MKRSALLAAAACVALAAQAQTEQPPRWVKADDLRVRAGPGLDQPVVGVLQRGSQVVQKSLQPFDGFCLVEGDGLYGHVACQYLSAEPVPRPRAGQGDVPADRRWVVGSAVNLRAAPARDAQVLGRLAINRSVRLLRADAAPGYCEVQPLDRSGGNDGASGYTACQYLAPEPLSAATLAGMDPDTARAFWRAPSRAALEAHAQALAAKLPDAATGPWPRDDTLERMKAHLALGVQGAAQPPLADWAELKRLAAANDPALLKEPERSKARSGADRELWMREYRASSAAQKLQAALGLWGDLHDAISSADGAPRMIQLVRALELPAVGASLFRSDSELAPPGDRAEALAGRFHSIVRTVVQPRGPRHADEPREGLYDMFSLTQQLTRPVQWVRLYRDGTLRSEATVARRTERPWRLADEPMCEGWTPGFAYGDVDGPVWRYFNEPGSGNAAAQRAQAASRQHRPAGSLFAFHALAAPPSTKARRTEAAITLDRTSTGFVGLVQLAYDLDSDGVPDLLVLEARGHGPGHLGDVTTTDDPWHRVLFANINGQWKVLASDSFGYGCGC